MLMVGRLVVCVFARSTAINNSVTLTSPATATSCRTRQIVVRWQLLLDSVALITDSDLPISTGSGLSLDPFLVILAAPPKPRHQLLDDHMSAMT
jgi:hypothetical protein